MSIPFPHIHQIFLGIYLKKGPTCLTRLGRDHVPAQWANSRQLFLSHSLRKTLFQISVFYSISETGNSHWMPKLGCLFVFLWGGRGWFQTFSKRFQQILCLAGSMRMVMSCRMMAPSFNIPGCLSWMASRNHIKIAQAIPFFETPCFCSIPLYICVCVFFYYYYYLWCF